LCGNLGWLNTFRALILPLPTAFGVFIMRQAILEVPQDLIYAAKLDGCGNLRIFFQVVLPLVKSSVLALAIFTFVGAWNNFIWPLVACSAPEMKTLPLALSAMKTQYNTDVGLTMACAVINFLPPFLFYLFLQSRFKEGMTLSGMKD
jgi:multiple sugar transport system permease protein